MSEPFNLSQAQDGAERMALMVAQYYDTLIRQGMPQEVATQLAQGYQMALFQLFLGLVTIKQQKGGAA